MIPKAVISAPSAAWNYDLGACPRGSKLLLLTDGGIAIIGHLADSTKGYIAWSPLPDRDKVKEKAIATATGRAFL